ncbi:hypothetical protein ACHAQJ_002039 [Trichoderma viride]
MDTPAVPLPQDAREQAVLDDLVVIRDKLLLLKQDRTTYIRSQDIIPLYDETIARVKELNEIRTETWNKEENRLDRVLESCFQLLSLFYLTIGRNNEIPANYALTSTIKRLLDHLTEADLYSAKDLESLKTTLSTLSKSITQAKSLENKPENYPYLIKLLSNRVEKCQSMLENLQKRLGRLGQPLLATHERLISLLRCISFANTKSKFSIIEVQKLQKQLQDIGEKRKESQFIAEDGSVPQGAVEIGDLYQRCLKWSEIVLEK